MRTLKALLLWLFLSLGTQVSAADIESITPTDDKTLIVTATGGVELPTQNVEAEIKILQDTPVGFAGISLEDPKKLILDLSAPLEVNTSYNLIGIVWVDTLIDFKTSEDLTLPVIATYESAIDSQVITHIELKDSRSLELSFSQDLTPGDFEFKILSELNIQPILSANTSQFIIPMQDRLLANKDYIMMVLSLKDINGTLIELDEELHDFTTPVELIIQPDFAPEAEENEELPEEPAIVPEPTIIPDLNEETEVVPEEIELNAADETHSGNLADIAAQAEVIPETGTATNILILLTVLLTGVIFIRKKM